MHSVLHARDSACMVLPERSGTHALMRFTAKGHMHGIDIVLVEQYPICAKRAAGSYSMSGSPTHAERTAAHVHANNAVHIHDPPCLLDGSMDV